MVKVMIKESVAFIIINWIQIIRYVRLLMKIHKRVKFLKD